MPITSHNHSCPVIELVFFGDRSDFLFLLSMMSSSYPLNDDSVLLSYEFLLITYLDLSNMSLYLVIIVIVSVQLSKVVS